MGLAAEAYADTPAELEHVLRFVPPAPVPPDGPPEPRHQCAARAEPRRGRGVRRPLRGPLSGIVVHDNREMGPQTDRLITVMRELNARLCERPGGPVVFLEYAAGLEPGWFVEVAERLQDAERVSCCIDVGHLGIRQASASFAQRHPGLSLRSLSPEDGRLA